MTTARAFARLFPPCLFLFLGLLIFRDWHSEPVLIGIALCAASLAWLIIAILQVIRLLRVAQVEQPGFPVNVPAAPATRAG
jgi:hypothetical protein